jgi:hypothetical protein
MKEHDGAVVLARADRDVAHVGRRLGELGQLVVVGREQRAAFPVVVQVLGDGPGDREAVVGARAAADLVEDDEGCGASPAQDGGGRASRP